MAGPMARRIDSTMPCDAHLCSAWDPHGSWPPAQPTCLSRLRHHWSDPPTLYSLGGLAGDCASRLEKVTLQRTAKKTQILSRAWPYLAGSREHGGRHRACPTCSQISEPRSLET